MEEIPLWLKHVRWNEGAGGPESASIPPALDLAHPELLPLVSVVVPTRNRARYLRRTIDSILGQDYPRVECIVIDGASMDGSAQVLESYGDRIRWVSERDSGPFDAINRGWAMASGTILAWLNADDTYEPHAIACAVGYLETHPDVDIVHGACGLTDDTGRLKSVMTAPRWDLDVAFEHCEHFIYQPTAFMRRSAVDRAGGGVYPEWSHDYDLWFRVALTGGVIREITTHLANARGDQPENDKGLPDRYAPAMVSMIQRLSARPDLPPRLQLVRRRALSNAQARGVRYIRLRYRHHWTLAGRYLMQAARTDPANVPAIIRDSLIVLGWRHHTIAHGERVGGATLRLAGRVARRLGGPSLWNPSTVAFTVLAIQAWAISRILRDRSTTDGAAG